jgi:hypothetical protein
VGEATVTARMIGSIIASSSKVAPVEPAVMPLVAVIGGQQGLQKPTCDGTGATSRPGSP